MQGDITLPIFICTKDVLGFYFHESAKRIALFIKKPEAFLLRASPDSGTILGD
jgi:hypothetical protein